METIHSLVTAAQCGDLEAFGEIVRRFQDMAYAGAYTMVDDAQLAEDVAQEAFMEAYLNLPKLREAAAFPGWFRRIIFKQGDRLIRGKHISTMPLDAAFTMPLAELNPELLAERQEMSETVRHAVDALPEHERIVTILFYSTGYALKEIADFLEVPVTTVKKRLYDARQHLKEDLLGLVRESLHEHRPSAITDFPERVQLLIAAHTGDIAWSKMLLDRQPMLINMRAERGDQVAPLGTLISPGHTALHEAVANGHTALIEVLIEYGANIDAMTSNGITPLHAATLYHAQAVVKLLLARGANANMMFANGHTPLHWATIRGYTDSVELLLGAGANVNARSHGGRTPLHWAALKGHVLLVKLLLEHGADSSVRDELGHTSLDWAMERKHTMVAILLRKQNGVETAQPQ